MQTKNQIPPRSFPIPQLRELLRQQAMERSALLSRSVGRLTSCEALPCLEYGEEVLRQQELAEQLLYLQQCRDALERCIGGSSVTLRYRRSDHTTTVTRFRREGVNRVKVWGLPDPIRLGGPAA